MQRHPHRVSFHKTVHEQRVMLLPGSRRAEERVAALLLDVSERLTKLGHSPSDFLLRMAPEEIGTLLGLNLETVSRIFSKFQKDALIEVNGDEVGIVSIEGLRAVVGR